MRIKSDYCVQSNESEPIHCAVSLLCSCPGSSWLMMHSVTCLVSCTCKNIKYSCPKDGPAFYSYLNRNVGIKMVKCSCLHASSKTQGLLAGTMRYFRASDIFGRKFTLSAEEPLGTYSYRTSSRSGRILFH